MKIERKGVGSDVLLLQHDAADKSVDLRDYRALLRYSNFNWPILHRSPCLLDQTPDVVILEAELVKSDLRFSPLVFEQWAEFDCVLGSSWRGFSARANFFLLESYATDQSPFPDGDRGFSLSRTTLYPQ